jgi:predicted secreted protein
MNWTSAVAIFVLFWVMSAFLVMPFHVRTAGEIGEPLVPGQSESAPAQFKPLRILCYTTILAVLIFSLFYANYVAGWITTEMLDITKL